LSRPAPASECRASPAENTAACGSSSRETDFTRPASPLRRQVAGHVVERWRARSARRHVFRVVRGVRGDYSSASNKSEELGRASSGDGTRHAGGTRAAAGVRSTPVCDRPGLRGRNQRRGTLRRAGGRTRRQSGEVGSHGRVIAPGGQVAGTRGTGTTAERPVPDLPLATAHADGEGLVGRAGRRHWSRDRRTTAKASGVRGRWANE